MNVIFMPGSRGAPYRDLAAFCENDESSVLGFSDGHLTFTKRLCDRHPEALRAWCRAALASWS